MVERRRNARDEQKEQNVEGELLRVEFSDEEGVRNSIQLAVQEVDQEKCHAHQEEHQLVVAWDEEVSECVALCLPYHIPLSPTSRMNLAGGA